MQNLIVILILGAVAYIAWAYMKREKPWPRVLPYHDAYTVTCPPEMRDATDRAQRFFLDFHHQSEAVPLIVSQLAWHEPDEDKPRGMYVVGIPADAGERGLSSLKQNFRGAIIKPVKPEELPLYRPVFAGWTREDEEKSRLEEERRQAEATREAEKLHRADSARPQAEGHDDDYEDEGDDDGDPRPDDFFAKDGG